ncbi:MAG: hypothetical protein AB1831_08220 [Pseudomonadota bacterium]
MIQRIDLWRLRLCLKDRRLAVKASIGGGWFIVRLPAGGVR